jgi:tRNA(Ile)-lysidine synthetase-like protein
LLRRTESPSLRRIEFEIELTPESPARTPFGTIHVGPANGIGQRIQLPKNARPHFIVRMRRSGDRFQPLGMPQAKKLKDFLIDRKIPADARDRLPLVTHDGEIVWIAGVEVSEKYKVSSPADGETWELWMER